MITLVVTFGQRGEQEVGAAERASWVYIGPGHVAFWVMQPQVSQPYTAKQWTFII